MKYRLNKNGCGSFVRGGFYIFFSTLLSSFSDGRKVYDNLLHAIGVSSVTQRYEYTHSINLHIIGVSSVSQGFEYTHLSTPYA